MKRKIIQLVGVITILLTGCSEVSEKINNLNTPDPQSAGPFSISTLPSAPPVSPMPIGVIPSATTDPGIQIPTSIEDILLNLSGNSANPKNITTADGWIGDAYFIDNREPEYLAIRIVVRNNGQELRVEIKDFECEKINGKAVKLSVDLTPRLQGYAALWQVIECR